MEKLLLELSEWIQILLCHVDIAASLCFCNASCKRKNACCTDVLQLICSKNNAMAIRPPIRYAELNLLMLGRCYPLTETNNAIATQRLREGWASTNSVQYTMLFECFWFQYSDQHGVHATSQHCICGQIAFWPNVTEDMCSMYLCQPKAV